MKHQLAFPVFRPQNLFVSFKRHLFSTVTRLPYVEAKAVICPAAVVEPMEVEGVDVEYLSDGVNAAYEDDDLSSSRKRSKKRKIYCFNCNRQEFHIMAYKGTTFHSFLVGMSFGLARIFGPYRCTCCGKKRAMFADFCSLSYHWRIASERRLSKTGRRRSKSRRRK